MATTHPHRMVLASRLTAVTDNPVAKFFLDGRRLLNRCTKPERREFTRLARVTAVGVLAMGTMGVVTKLVFGMLLRGRDV